MSKSLTKAYNIKQAREALKSAAEKPLPQRNTARSAVEQLKPEIEALKRKGWKVKEIAKYLSGLGIKLSASSLQKYLSEKEEEPVA